ncbi:MAG: hypothetical protein PWR09_1190, partial [Archaeoglobi archaeon]|nr:hypothetical protein [Archaeoglobi archaeon]
GGFYAKVDTSIFGIEKDDHLKVNIK